MKRSASTIDPRIRWNRFAIGAVHLVAPGIADQPYFAQYVGPGRSVLDNWLRNNFV